MKERLTQYDFADTVYMETNWHKFSPVIGQYIIEFSFLEHALNVLIAELLHDRSHELGYIVTTKMSMADKIDLLDRYVNYEKHQGIQASKDLASLISDLRAVNTFRNSVAHANWAVMKRSGKTRVKVVVDKNRGVWFKLKDLSIKELNRNINLLKDLTVNLQMIEFDHWEIELEKT